MPSQILFLLVRSLIPFPEYAGNENDLETGNASFDHTTTYPYLVVGDYHAGHPRLLWRIDALPPSRTRERDLLRNGYLPWQPSHTQPGKLICQCHS